MNRILITGASGQLGSAVTKLFIGSYDILLTDFVFPKDGKSRFEKMDITDENSVRKTIKKFQPDIILHLAAMTDVDGCELNPQKANDVNVRGTKNLLEHFDGKFVFISTDYVFDGNSGPYSEADTPNPINEYGRSKLLAENIVMDSGNPWLIVRTNVVYDYTENTQASFVKWVVDSLRNDIPILVVNDQWNNPTWTVALASALIEMIEKDFLGVWNYGGAEYIHRLEFAKEIAKVFELNKALISPCRTQELNQPAPRPLKGGLSTKKIKHAGIEPYLLRKSLEEIRKKMTL